MLKRCIFRCWLIVSVSILNLALFCSTLKSLCSLLTLFRLSQPFLILRLALVIVQTSDVSDRCSYFRRTGSCKLLSSLPIESPPANVSFTRAQRCHFIFSISPTAYLLGNKIGKRFNPGVERGWVHDVKIICQRFVIMIGIIIISRFQRDILKHGGFHCRFIPERAGFFK